MNKVRDIIFKNKKQVIGLCILAAILLGGVIFVWNDYEMYSKTIAKVTEVRDVLLREESNEHGVTEEYYKQSITAIIKNGEKKGGKVEISNEYSKSGTYDEKYEKGDEVFISLGENSNGELKSSITGVKRDKYVAVLAAFFIWMVIAVARRRGVFAIASVCANIGLYYVALQQYNKGNDILEVCNILVIVYTILSALIIMGIGKKTILSIISILISLFITMTIFKVVMYFGGDIEYWMMDYLVNPDDLEELFMSGILIGGLGAIMDVAITIVSSLNEIYDKNNDIEPRKMVISGREIGHDIMGTMINVLLFTFICGSIPQILVKLKNGISLSNIIENHMSFEIYRFLVGSIGIVLTIPVAIGVTVVFLKFRNRGGNQ